MSVADSQPSSAVPGPGVPVPFAAPPTERKFTRLWIGLGVGAFVLFLSCAGCLGGGVFLYSSFVEKEREQASTAVKAYLGALHDGDYGRAYSMLCQSRKNQGPVLYTNAQKSDPVLSFTVGRAEIDANMVRVAATVRTEKVGTRTADFSVFSEDALMRVCAGPV